ncbi:MAG: hypothetical protein L0211_02770 [Planctomycetaceae bacterium]|nr:hypothetical protein [Planctomycetaceae bacterium]
MSGGIAVRDLCAAIAVGVMLFLAGCGKPDDGRLASYPVHGKVTVDGKPTAGVYVFLNPAKQPPTHGIFPNAVTDEKGEFWVSTYDAEDGAPLGDYIVTAKWPMGEGLMVSSDSPDRLKNRYTDPAKSTINMTVKESTRAKPNEVPPLELTSQ